MQKVKFMHVTVSKLKLIILKLIILLPLWNDIFGYFNVHIFDFPPEAYI